MEIGLNPCPKISRFIEIAIAHTQNIHIFTINREVSVLELKNVISANINLHIAVILS